MRFIRKMIEGVDIDYKVDLMIHDFEESGFPLLLTKFNATYRSMLLQMVKDGNENLAWVVLFIRRLADYADEDCYAGIEIIPCAKRLKTILVAKGMSQGQWKSLHNIDKDVARRLALTPIEGMEEIRLLFHHKNIPEIDGLGFVRFLRTFTSVEQGYHDLFLRSTKDVFEHLHSRQDDRGLIRAAIMIKDTFIMLNQMKGNKLAKKIRKSIERLADAPYTAHDGALSEEKFTEWHDALATEQRKIKDSDFEEPFEMKIVKDPARIVDGIDLKEGESVVHAKSPKDLHRWGEDQNNCIYSRRNRCREGKSLLCAIKRKGKTSSVFEVSERSVISGIGTHNGRIFGMPVLIDEDYIDYAENCNNETELQIAEHKAKGNTEPTKRDEQIARAFLDCLKKYKSLDRKNK